MSLNAYENRIQELKSLEKKTRHIVYEYKRQLTDVLRYNSGGTIVPIVFEEELRKILSSRRNGVEFNNICIGVDNDNLLNGFKSEKGWKFDTGDKKIQELKKSGNTYMHTGSQGLALHKYGKISLESGDIDEIQFIVDKIINNLHDRSEIITDDIPPFKKDQKFRENERKVEHELIDNCKSLQNNEKEYLKYILDYKKNSRFKTYEHILCMHDAIDMMDNNENYNEVLSVIYEMVKFNLPKFLGNLELNNNEIKHKLYLAGIRAFFIDNMENIDQLFEYIRENREKMYQEGRFKDNDYDKNDLKGKFEELKQPWEKIKKIINEYK